MPGLGAPVVPLAGGLTGPGQRSADHHRVRAAGDRLGDVAGAAQCAVRDDVDVAAAGFVQVVAPGLGNVRQRGGHRHLDAQDVAGALGGAAAEADQDAGGARPHQVQGGLVGGAAAHDHRHVELVDELLQVQRLGLPRDVLGGHRGAADHEEVQPGLLDDGRELGAGLRRQRAGHRHTGVPQLTQPGGDQLGLDRGGVQLLHAPGGGHLVVDAGQLLQQRGRVVVLRPQPFQVEHAQPAEPAEGDRGGRGHHGIHRRRHDREVEAQRVDPPAEVHLLDAAGPPVGDDGDVVEPEDGHGALGTSDVDHVASLPRLRLRTGRSSWGLRWSSGCRAGAIRAARRR